MKAEIQANYEERLSRYVRLIQGTEPPGLVPKLAIYRELLRQHDMHGNRLWKIEPVLHPLIFSAETDLHLATARLLEDPLPSRGKLVRVPRLLLEEPCEHHVEIRAAVSRGPAETAQ